MSSLAARLRLLAAVAATVAIVVPLGYLWWTSRIPSSFSMMSMGYRVDGGGPAGPMRMSGGSMAGGIDVATLTGPTTGTPDVDLTLTARQEPVRLRNGHVVQNAYTLNHTSPGPAIVATQGDLVQVTLVNASVTQGVTLHWHGVDLPNAEDGVAGITQNAVPVGGRYVYRFVAEHPGTYWYHSHQVSDDQVRRGLFGSLVIKPKVPAKGVLDTTAIVHTYDGVVTVNGVPGQSVVPARPGQVVRVRLIDADDGPLQTWVAGTPFRMVALDGRDWHGPTPVIGKAVLIGAGGRTDLEFTMPPDGAPVRVGVGGGDTSVLVGDPAVEPVPSQAVPITDLNLLNYGTPDPAGVGFDPDKPNRVFHYSIGRRPGFVNGRPGLWWSINGHLFPDVPMFQVALGDVVKMTISNHSGQTHPMHLHGHHLLVLSKNGKPCTGSPWWTDTVNVASGDRYVVAFVADNPGIWADHCHNLQHAQQGLVTHLEYIGYTSRFVIGGPHHNTVG